MLVVICCLYAAWFWISVLHHVNRNWTQKLVMLDYFHFVPSWRLFTRDPIKYDFFLLYRDRINGSIGEFRLVNVYHNDYHWRFIFNPVARIAKAFLDHSLMIMHEAKINTSREHHLTKSHYLMLLKMVMKEPLAKEAQRQFVVVTTVGRDTNFTPKILIASDFHGY